MRSLKLLDCPLRRFTEVAQLQHRIRLVLATRHRRTLFSAKRLSSARPANRDTNELTAHLCRSSCEKAPKLSYRFGKGAEKRAEKSIEDARPLTPHRRISWIWRSLGEGEWPVDNCRKPLQQKDFYCLCVPKTKHGHNGDEVHPGWRVS